MRMMLKNYAMIVLLSMVSMLAITNWYYTGDPTKFFLIAHVLETENENIENVNVEFADKKVYLNVHLKKQTTCKKIIADLGINNIAIGSRSYAPSCTVANKKLIRITYSEIINV